ncbi:hypothetical protein B0H14DRAFT_3706864 [Mycena olivaceomarginata]|nr:hypothetical protein B0H14DRAFT_3706864 [Mycena olivaceomarginata]
MKDYSLCRNHGDSRLGAWGSCSLSYLPYLRLPFMSQFLCPTHSLRSNPPSFLAYIESKLTLLHRPRTRHSFSPPSSPRAPPHRHLRVQVPPRAGAIPWWRQARRARQGQGAIWVVGDWDAGPTSEGVMFDGLDCSFRVPFRSPHIPPLHLPSPHLHSVPTFTTASIFSLRLPHFASVLVIPFAFAFAFASSPTILSFHSFLFSPLLSRPLYHFASLSSASPSLSLSPNNLSPLSLLLFGSSHRLPSLFLLRSPHSFRINFLTRQAPLLRLPSLHICFTLSLLVLDTLYKPLGTRKSRNERTLRFTLAGTVV